MTYGRQIGTYPILVGLPYDLDVNRFMDVKITSHGARSVTAVEFPLDVNRASLKALEALPGVGAKRAARIVRHRPFANLAGLAAALDDTAVVEGVRSFVGLSS